MKPEELKRMHEMVGAIKAFGVVGNFVNAGRLTMLKQMKDGGFFKLTGKDWKTFCKEDLGRDLRTINDEIAALESFGEPFLVSLERIGLKKRDLNVLSQLPDDAKANIKTGEIQIGEQMFLVEDIPDKADEFLHAFSLLAKELELTKKEVKQVGKKLEGFDGEQKKSEKGLLKKISDLEAMTAPIETPEHILAGFERIDKAFSDLDTVVRTFVWKGAKNMVLADLPLQAKIQGIQEQMRARVEGLIRDWDAEVTIE
jgi:hypothetical protein